MPQWFYRASEKHFSQEVTNFVPAQFSSFVGVNSVSTDWVNLFQFFVDFFGTHVAEFLPHFFADRGKTTSFGCCACGRCGSACGVICRAVVLCFSVIFSFPS